MFNTVDRQTGPSLVGSWASNEKKGRKGAMEVEPPPGIGKNYDSRVYKFSTWSPCRKLLKIKPPPSLNQFHRPLVDSSGVI